MTKVTAHEAANGKASFGLKDNSFFHETSFIEGKFCEVQDTDKFAVLNPSTGAVIAQISEPTPDEEALALSSAEKTFASWRDTGIDERLSILRKAHALLTENRDDFARILTAENGKPLAEGLWEVDTTARLIDWYCQSSLHYTQSYAQQREKSALVMATREPVGVCLIITPWNAPLALMAMKSVAALATGCTVISKPSETAPLSALAFAEVVRRAGLPAGALNVVVTLKAKEFCTAMLNSSIVRLLSFTGSTSTASKLAPLAAANHVRTVMELGGHAPFIVFNDANVETAINNLIHIKFMVAGQVCVSPNNIMVQEDIHDAFVEALSSAMKQNLKLGDGFQEGVNVGPMITSDAVKRIHAWVDEAVSRGAKVIVGGNEVAQRETPNANGNFYPPTLVVGVPDDCKLAQCEIFGPVIATRKFTTEEEALSRANSFVGGLAGYLFTGDTARALRLPRQLDCGMVGVNSVDIFHPSTAFGGVGHSGHGVEGSILGLESFTNSKFVLMHE